MKHQRLCLLWLVGALAVSEGRLLAVPSRQTVQKNAEEVFSRPEFSRLQKLLRSDLVEEDLSRQTVNGEGEGNGRPNGEENGGRNDRGDNPRGDRNDDRGNPRRADNDFQRNRTPRGRTGRTSPQRGSSFRPGASIGGFGSAMGSLFSVLGGLAIIMMIIVIVMMVIKAIMDRESRLEQELTGTFANDVGELEVDHPPSEFPSDEYLSRAAQFAQQGDYRQAVAFVLLGAMSEVESRGFIRYRKGLTQRDYYRTVRRHETIGPAYRHILKIYEPLGFGRRTAELKHYQTAVNSFRGGFRDRIAISEV